MISNMRTITLFIILVVTAFFNASAVNFAGGSGTEGDPYQIETADQLNAVRENLAAHYILMNDIDLSKSEYIVWRPLGKPEVQEKPGDFTPFSGTFDGNGHVISGLNILWEGNYVGFFSVVSGLVMNLGVKGQLTISNGSGAGLISGYIGQTTGGMVMNCFAEGTVSTNNGTGASGIGLLGANIAQQGAIYGCYSKGVVSAPEMQYVGGVIGRQMQVTASIFDCYSDVSVTGKTNVGGVAGRIYSKPADGMNAGFLYSTGRVIGEDVVGGVAGDLYNVYAAGLIAANTSITATKAGANIGRIGAIGSGAPLLEFCYGLNTTDVIVGGGSYAVVSDDTGKDGATKTLAELQDPELYEEIGWDLEMQWEMPSKPGLPIFQWQKEMSSNIEKTLTGSPVNIFMQAKLLHVTNIEIGSTITVYNSTGQLVRQLESTSDRETIILVNPGIYIVKVTGLSGVQSQKVWCE